MSIVPIAGRAMPEATCLYSAADLSGSPVLDTPMGRTGIGHQRIGEWTQVVSGTVDEAGGHRAVIALLDCVGLAGQRPDAAENIVLQQGCSRATRADLDKGAVRAVIVQECMFTTYKSWPELVAPSSPQASKVELLFADGCLITLPIT